MKKPKVLIVDDERNIRLAVSSAMEPLNLELTEATNGEEALRALRTQPFDLVLLDLRLPGIDGLDVLQRMRRGHDRTGVLIMTAYGSVDNAVEAMKLGAIDFVQKPFTPQELRRAVSGALKRANETHGGATVRPEPKGDPEATAPTRFESEHNYEDCIRQARASVELGAMEDAWGWARRAVAANPARPEGYNLMGALLELGWDHIDAQKYYRAALSMDPAYGPAQRNLSRTTSVEPRGSIDLGAIAPASKREGRS